MKWNLFDKPDEQTKLAWSLSWREKLHEYEELNEVTKSISEDFYHSLLMDRNTYWMERIPGILKSGSSLIAVGARHLVGDDGLINMLRKAGYTVEPVIQNKN